MNIILNNKKLIGEDHEPYFIAELNTSHLLEALSKVVSCISGP